MTREFGVALVAIALLAAAAAPFAAPHSPDAHFPGLLNAPPTVVHLSGLDGRWHAPFIHRWRLVNQLEQRYEEDRTTSVPLSWFSGGRLVRSSNDEAAPLLLLGADSYGRDVFTRLIFGARTSLALAVLAALGAMLIGVAMGGVAGFAGGALDDVLMRSTDFVMVLPTIYVALALRSVLPLVLTAGEVFALLAAIFAVVGAPFVARGVRAIVRTERRLEYAAAARRPRSERRAPPDPASVAGVARIHRRPDDAARSRVHHRGSDALVRRARLSGSGRQLGHDAPRRLEQYPRLRRFSVAPEPGGGDVPGRPGHQPCASEQRASKICRTSVKSHHESFRRSFSYSYAVRRSRSRGHRPVEGGARQVDDEAAHWHRGPRIQRRSRADGRLRMRSGDRRRARRRAAREDVHRRHRPRVDARRDQGDEARGRARRRRRAGPDAWLLQEPDDQRRVRPALHGGRRRVAGAGAALQLHRRHRCEPAAGGGRAAGDAPQHRRHEGIGRRRRAGRGSRVADAARLHRARRRGRHACIR